MRRSFVSKALRVAAIALACGSVRADEIALIPAATIKVSGGLLRGSITSETPSEVKIRAASGDQAVPLDQIASISYDGVPPSFSLAELSARQGNFEQAAEQYKKAAAEASGKPYIVQAAAYRRADILADAAMASPARASEVIAELDDFIKKNPTSRHLGPALETLARLHLQKGDTTKADAALTTLGEKVPAALDRASVLKARVLSKSGKNDQAIAALDKILLMNKNAPQVREAKLVKAECLAGANKFDESLSLVQDVIKEAPPEAAEVQALAYNTLGDCYTAARRPKDALLAYLRTDILYDKDKEQHPRALSRIEQLFRDLKQDGRADEVRERLRKEYPQSPWSKAAKAK